MKPLRSPRLEQPAGFAFRFSLSHVFCPGTVAALPWGKAAPGTPRDLHRGAGQHPPSAPSSQPFPICTSAPILCHIDFVIFFFLRDSEETWILCLWLALPKLLIPRIYSPDPPQLGDISPGAGTALMCPPVMAEPSLSGHISIRRIQVRTRSLPLCPP